VFARDGIDNHVGPCVVPSSADEIGVIVVRVNRFGVLTLLVVDYTSGSFG